MRECTRPGFSIIRWQSSGRLVALRRLFTTGGPMVMLGTKCPSMMSTWMTVAPPRSAAATSSARCAKSAESIDAHSSTMEMESLSSQPQCISRHCGFRPFRTVQPPAIPALAFQRFQQNPAARPHGRRSRAGPEHAQQIQYLRAASPGSCRVRSAMPCSAAVFTMELGSSR